MRGKILIGCSGWQYRSWRGPFYPATMPLTAWLGFYATNFPTVEVNNTFYRLPEASTFDTWRTRTPSNFVFTIKASRYLTHLTRLRAPSEPLTRLYSRAIRLGTRLGPILYQLPETFAYDQTRLRLFLRALASRSQRAIEPSKAQSTEAARTVRRLRHVIEFRHPSWYRDDVFEMLREADVAVCLHDMPGAELIDPHDTPFMYVRFHGTAGKYRGSYSTSLLRAWALKLTRTAARGRPAYAYFNNDIDATAVRDARALIKYAGSANPSP